jgi:hypothetical protein
LALSTAAADTASAWRSTLAITSVGSMYGSQNKQRLVTPIHDQVIGSVEPRNAYQRCPWRRRREAGALRGGARPCPLRRRRWRGTRRACACSPRPRPRPPRCGARLWLQEEMPCRSRANCLGREERPNEWVGEGSALFIVEQNRGLCPPWFLAPTRPFPGTPTVSKHA